VTVAYVYQLLSLTCLGPQHNSRPSSMGGSRRRSGLQRCWETFHLRIFVGEQRWSGCRTKQGRRAAGRRGALLRSRGEHHRGYVNRGVLLT
jgi:hypothetical protein